MNGVDVEGIRPRKVQIYLMGSEMCGNAKFETAKTTLACWGKLQLFTPVPVIIIYPWHIIVHTSQSINSLTRSVVSLRSYYKIFISATHTLLVLHVMFRMRMGSHQSCTIFDLWRAFALFTWLMQ